jgi:hypothetical protein
MACTTLAERASPMVKFLQSRRSRQTLHLSRRPPSQICPRLNELSSDIDALGNNSTFLAQMAKNVYVAYRTFLDKVLNGNGGDDFSELAHVYKVLGYRKNETFVGLAEGGAESF